MILWFIRAIFLLLVLSLMLLGFIEGGPFHFMGPDNLILHQWMALLGCLGVLVLGFIVDLQVAKKRVGSLVGIFFGLMMGLMIGMTFNYLVEFIYETYNLNEQSSPDLYMAQEGIKWLINVFCCFIAVIFVIQTKDDFRFIIPYVEFSKQTKGVMPMILDTSVIIDGRIADVATTHIITSPFIVPRFILNELHNVADSSDRLRRNRGRRGLDMLNKMQRNPDVDITIQDINLTTSEKAEPVDHQLVSTAKKMSGKIVTNDYNLNKVASIRGIDVININDLANSLKTVVLPGESLRTKLVKPGDQYGQGVGYMEDGTMIVVEQGRQYIGRDVDIVVTSVLQTSAGRMIFGKLPEHNGTDRRR